jgi:hypothetical protein
LLTEKGSPFAYFNPYQLTVMRILTVIALILSLCTTKSYAQDTLPFKVKFDEYRMTNSELQVKDNMNLIKKVLNHQFTNLITGQTQNSIGNFASLDLAEASVSFAGNLILDTSSVLTIKAAGGVSDGLFSVFNNSKLNTNISLDIQYNFMRFGKQKLLTNVDSTDQYEQSIDKIKYDYDVKRLAIANDKGCTDLKDRNKKTEIIIDSLDKAIGNAADPDTIANLNYLKAKTKLLCDSIKHAIDYYDQSEELQHLHDQTVSQLDKLSLESAVVGFSFGWFSAGYKVTNNSFKLFSSSSPFSSQVLDTSFVSHEARVQYSYYKWVPKSYHSFFVDGGLAFSYTDNFNSLKKTELSETTEYGSNPGDRTQTKKFNAYQGTYTKDIKGLTPYVDFYYFLFNNNIGAIHANPQWVMQSKEKPVGNFYVGFLMAFKGTKTDNPIVNAELYYQFLDVFKTTDTDYKLFERNNIGIRFSFPIQFKYK